jgi:uncharacterized membrane protein YedE/YeeE
MSGRILRRWLALLSAVLAGVIFGVGLIVSGMSDPQKVTAFLDVGARWDPSLAFVMIGAIAVASAGFLLARNLRRRGAGAVLADALPAGTRSGVDRRLVLGSVIFGAGWGLSGICPGPAVVIAATGAAGGGVFFGTMIAAMVVFALTQRLR